MKCQRYGSRAGGRYPAGPRSDECRDTARPVERDGQKRRIAEQVVPELALEGPECDAFVILAASRTDDGCARALEHDVVEARTRRDCIHEAPVERALPT